MTDADAKIAARRESQKLYWAFLDKRIPELHKAGVLGRNARTQADAEYAKVKRES